jgi:uncharacterized protein YqjF (DUF2071 family)
VKPAGTQLWRDLLFLHWTLRPDVLRRALSLPQGVDLHLFDDQAWVGIVAFGMEGVRPTTWWPQVLGLRFLETNLRTYVSYRGGPPAVWFLSLETESGLAVHGARISWGLPYYKADMTYGREGRLHSYRSVRRTRKFTAFEAKWLTLGEPAPAVPGTLDSFLVEQYELLSRKGRTLLRGRVAHPPYAVQPVKLASCGEDLFERAGLPRAEGPPAHACFSPGVDVEVFGPERIEP